MSSSTDAVKEAVLRRIAGNEAFHSIGNGKFRIRNQSVHARVCRTTSSAGSRYRFNINPNTLSVDHEIWICGDESCYYLVPATALHEMYFDPAAYQDRHNPKIRVVSVDTVAHFVSYARGGLKYNLRDHYLAKLPKPLTGPERADELRAEGTAAIEPYDPRDEHDGRVRVLASLVQRQGQGGFRRELLHAYNGRCAITGWAVTNVLEAAHILPYRGEHTNHVPNGLLLRSDLHALFDLHLIEIDPETYSVVIDPSLADTPYGEMHGWKLRLPTDSTLWPSSECLRLHSTPRRA